MWSCTVFGHFSHPVFRKMLRLLDGVDPLTVDEVSWKRIHQVYCAALC